MAKATLNVAGTPKSPVGHTVRAGAGTPSRPADDAHAAHAAPVGTTVVSEAVNLVRARWASEDEFTPATLDKCGEAIVRFARRLQALGVTSLEQVTSSHCQGFIDAATRDGPPPALTTRHARRTALRMLFRALRERGNAVGDPTLDLGLPARSDTAARPLTDLEVTLCRASSRMGESGGRSLHRAVCWALGETSAVTSEISAIRVGDVDSATVPRWVRLPGTRRHDPRLGELSDWGAVIISRQLQLLAQRHATPGSLLTYRGQGLPGEHMAQSAVCNAIGGVLQISGVGDEPDVRPASLRNWAGRRLYDAGMPIEQVARRLGARSLDTVASDIALTWRTDP